MTCPYSLPSRRRAASGPWPPSVPGVGPHAEQLELPGASRDGGLARPLRASVSPLQQERLSFLLNVLGARTQ